MRLKRKIVALLTALMMVLTIFSSGTAAFAATVEGKAPTLSATAQGEAVAVTLSASEDISLNGLAYTLEYDGDAFSVTEDDITAATGFDEVDKAIESGKVTVNADSEDPITVSNGQSLATLLMTPSDGYDKTKEYTFTLSVTNAYNGDLDDYSWNKDTIKASYCEEPAAEEYVTFIDTAGNETKLTTSLIESCDKTANENYLLKDVLTAAGVTENLADCRYEMSASDGFVVYLDADDYDNLALFYSNGWRSTVEDATNYSGGWYKVKGLTTITAENHNHVDGICTNVINTARTDTIACGDVEETPILTGWQKVDGEWYYYNSDGTMLKNGWAKDSAGWCWLGEDGKITKSKWVKDNGDWYYLKANGYMAANEWAQDSKGWCYLSGSGKMVTNGWAKDSKGWCWMGSDGYWVKNKWIQDKGEWYYIKSNGYMAANEWAKDSTGWMYMDGSGKITKSKWVKSGGYWYYLKSNGYMATGTQTIGGKTYKFDSSGRWIS